MGFFLHIRNHILMPKCVFFGFYFQWFFLIFLFIFLEYNLILNVVIFADSYSFWLAFGYLYLFNSSKKLLIFSNIKFFFFYFHSNNSHANIGWSNELVLCVFFIWPNGQRSRFQSQVCQIIRFHELLWVKLQRKYSLLLWTLWMRLYYPFQLL